MNNYYLKYLKYKNKYLTLRKNNSNNSNKSISQFGGNKYDCNPNAEFSLICKENPDGKYKSKDSCQNDCEGKHISYKLSTSIIRHERYKFVGFIKDLIDADIDVYIVGGNALGLKILKMIAEKYTGREFEKIFQSFLELELIKDWDFSAYTNKPITEKENIEFDKLASSYKLARRARTFILYQTHKPIETDSKALFEINIQETDDYSTLEVPISRMKIKMTQHNLKYIFMFAHNFLAYKTSNAKFDMNLITTMIDKIRIEILPHHNGLFKVNKLTFNDGGLSKDLLKIINKFSSNCKEYEEFLIVQIKQPDRIFYRLIEKNIPKNDRIEKFLIENNCLKNKPSWLFDSNKILSLIKSFLKTLSDEMVRIYNNLIHTELLETIIDKYDAFYVNVDLGRVTDFYEVFDSKGKELLKRWLGDIYDLIQKENVIKFHNKIEEDTIMSRKEKNNKFINMLWFLDQQNFFLTPFHI
jgi:hypothetical protein